ncbi:hypothetical protein C8J56DRAFT_377590 [Mycena floridula]|nr:hypothetical protein C8J56DRAFT_377590 [Mycena floridula]
MPHRLSTARRYTYYKISDDVLVAILEYLDPASLWRACKALRRIFSLTMEYQSLRYKFELAISGMNDGPVPHSRALPHLRLQLLLAYRKDWPKLEWSHEHKIQIAVPALVGSSGGFIHHIRPHGAFNLLELIELPSCRTNRPPSKTRHLRYTTSEIEAVSVEVTQALVVMSHVFSIQGQVGIQIFFRDLWSFEKHPRALALSYEISSQAIARVARMAIVICGFKLVISIEFQGAVLRHLLMDWRTFACRWLDDQDVQLLDQDHLLTVSNKGPSPTLSLYSVTHVQNMVLVREYELPEAWRKSVIGFCQNGSPKGDFGTPHDALFYSSPEARIVAIVAKPSGHSRSSLCNWLFVKESYLKYLSTRKDRSRMSSRIDWNTWAQFALIKDMGIMYSRVRGPYLVGSRVVYLETEHAGRLHVIEFSPFADASTPPAWFWNGPRASLVPSETSRSISRMTLEGGRVEDIRVTEDNITLFMEIQQGLRIAKVLTFGAPPTRTPRRVL